MDLNLSSPVTLFQAHKTHWAKAGVQMKFKHKSDGEATGVKEESIHRWIFKGINKVL